MSQIRELLSGLPRSTLTEYGQDIDAAHETLLRDGDRAAKRTALLAWLARWQPCVFGRIAARPGADAGLDVCIVDATDLDRGWEHVGQRVQQARHAWKDHALDGRTSSLQVLFTCPELAGAAPSAAMLELLCQLVGVYLPERAPIHPDRLYLDSLPLRRRDGAIEMFLANVTVFFAGAHLTAFHDHRAPGGVLLNINAIGHHTAAMTDRGRRESPAAVLERMHATALRSVGNGGIGHPERLASTWHLDKDEQPLPPHRTGRPAQVPDGVDPQRYGGRYHVDVAVPSLFADPTPMTPADQYQNGWTNMLDYFTEERLPPYHHPALMHGCPVSAEHTQTNLWPPGDRSPAARAF
jgi:hypothetical protein